MKVAADAFEVHHNRSVERRRSRSIMRMIRRSGLGVLIVTLLAGLFLSVGNAEARRRAHSARHQHHVSRPAAAMVIDGRTGKALHAHNIDAPRHPASLTKIMTLYLLFEQLRAGKVHMDTELKVSEKAADQAPSKLDLPAGETIAVKDAIKALVTKSANDVAVVVAENIGGSESAFARAMTEKARALGMSRTVYRNASGLPNEEQTTTARDLITLAQQMLRNFPEYSRIFQTRFFQYKGHIYRNHNGLLFSYPGTEGMKTGYTQAAGFNLVITARRSGKHLIAVVLGGQSAFSRNQAMRGLLDAAWPSATTGGKPVEPVIASAAAPVLASRALPAASQSKEEPDEEAEEETPELPEPNPAFHSTPEEQHLQAQILAAINGGAPSGGGKRAGLPITAVLAGASGGKSSDGEAQPGSPKGEPAAQPPAAEAGSAQAGAVAPVAAEQPAASPAPVAAASEQPAAIPVARAVQIQGVWSQEPAPKGDLGPIAVRTPPVAKAMEPPLAAPAPVVEDAGQGETVAAQAPSSSSGAVQVAAASPAPAAPAPKPVSQYGPYNVQVGSYDDAAGAQTRLAAVMSAAEKVVKGHPAYLATAQISGKDVYRARYGSFSEKEASAACTAIKKHKFECMVVRAD